MKLEKIEKFSDWIKVYKLYRNSFPKYERKPFYIIWKTYKKDNTDIWIIKERNKFSGFAITLNSEDLILLDYFSVSNNKRGRGIGSQALKKLQYIYEKKRFFLEIESTYKESDNMSERVKRKRFYLNNGMSEMNFKVNVFGVEMEILAYNCKINFGEYQSVYFKNYGKFAKKYISEIN